MESTSFKSSANFGDLISFIPAMRSVGKKVTLYIRKNVEAFYYAGATHPVMFGDKQVMMNDYMFDMVKPLLMAQDFIEDVQVWEGQEVKVDLDKIYEFNVNKPYGSLGRWIFIVYPDLSCDLSGVYINVFDTKENLAKGKIIVSRSERYNNPLISYYFLKPYEKELLFTGTKQEHEKFCKDFNLEIQYLQVDNFITLAQALRQCRFHISNQTGVFQISEGLKIKRILELHMAVPNVMVIGKDAYDSYYQLGIEYYFKKLYQIT